jgi:hypothetical protein
MWEPRRLTHHGLLQGYLYLFFYIRDIRENRFDHIPDTEIRGFSAEAYIPAETKGHVARGEQFNTMFPGDLI